MKHVIITGGSSGIGKDLAKKYIQAGSHVTLIARDKNKLNEARNALIYRCINKDQLLLIFSADVSVKAEIKKVITRAIKQAGVPDILINCAGIAEPGYFDEQSEELFERAMNINYFGAIYSIMACLPDMKKKGGGKIVLISSAAGLIGLFGYAAYGASKFAVRGLGETLRQELKKDTISVSIVYPPDTDTPQLAFENKTKPEETKKITGMIKPWSSEKVAELIFLGINKNKFLITPGWQIKLLARFHSLFHPIINKVIDHKILCHRKY